MQAKPLRKQSFPSRWTDAEAALEAVPANIALLDSDGVIVRVNSAWTAFCEQNGGNPAATGVGVNYLAVCDAVYGHDMAIAARFADGIRDVIRGKCERFSLEYPCHSPQEQRWFVGYVVAANNGQGPVSAVVAHVDVSEQKRIQEQVRVLNLELEDRILSRTRELKTVVDALEAEILKRERLEGEILRISEREQGRIGRELHDGLGQDLAAIAMIAGTLTGRLKEESHPLVENAGQIAMLTRKAMTSARLMAKGLYPVEIGSYGLIPVLEDLVRQTKRLYGVHCELRQDGDTPDFGEFAGIHIFRIVQEAVANAVKHGRPSSIVIESTAGEGVHTFTVIDDGIGFDESSRGSGMGLHIMEYRARVIGADFEINRPEDGGCRMSCRMPHVQHLMQVNGH